MLPCAYNVSRLTMKFLLFLTIVFAQICNAHQETVTIAILAKDKAHTLALYLRCIEQQTWPKKQTNLYIRTNNNNDQTVCILRRWLTQVEHLYREIYFDDTDVPEAVQQFKQHEWNTIRFKVLGKIRQDSVIWAHKKGSHYFVADCDNFIKPHVIETLLKTKLPIIAPLLKKDNSAYYSNYHAATDVNGYFLGTPLYYMILNQEVKGVIEVPVVHCTYLISKEVLPFMCYDDATYRYEYVIFSDNARKQGIPQYIDNRQIYGRITMAEDNESLSHEPWLAEVLSY